MRSDRRRLDLARLGLFQGTDVFYAATKPTPDRCRTGPSSWSAAVGNPTVSATLRR